MHVLTGYGRDALGEQCVLAFTYSQQPALAHLFLGYAGAFEIAKRATVKVPVFKAVREGQKLGRSCPRLVEMPIREILAMPLDEARNMLGITPARYYQQAHTMWREAGVNPYELMPPVQKAA
jgi:ubiquinone biosynthesis protein COQ4